MRCMPTANSTVMRSMSMAQSGSARHPMVFAIAGFDLGLLLVEYVLGMYLNLFVQIPLLRGTSGMVTFMFSVAGPALMAHIMMAMMILFVTVGLVVSSSMTGDPWLRLTSSLALVFTGAAILGGIEFLFFGQASGYSFLMSIGFLGTILFVGATFYWARVGSFRAPTTTPPSGRTG